MSKLLSLFTLTLTFLANLKERAQSLANAVDARDSLIADLKAKLDAGNAEHDALLSRVAAAEKHSAELDALQPDIDAKANELAAAINDNPLAPNVNPITLAVTPPFVEVPVPEPVGDAPDPLAPASSAPAEFPNGAPTVPPPAADAAPAQ